MKLAITLLLRLNRRTSACSDTFKMTDMPLQFVRSIVAVCQSAAVADSSILCFPLQSPEPASFYIGVKLTELPSKKQQTSGTPWFNSLHHVIRSLPSPRVRSSLSCCGMSCHLNPSQRELFPALAHPISTGFARRFGSVIVCGAAHSALPCGHSSITMDAFPLESTCCSTYIWHPCLWLPLSQDLPCILLLI